tara:strand:- start:320 stop:529 length:210 start_codon:yes stop_codon:yes gene_type:complete
MKCMISDTFQAIIDTSLAIELANAVGMQDVADNLDEGLESAVQTLASMPEELFTEDELEFLAVASMEQN